MEIKQLDAKRERRTNQPLGRVCCMDYDSKHSSIWLWMFFLLWKLEDYLRVHYLHSVKSFDPWTLSEDCWFFFNTGVWWYRRGQQGSHLLQVRFNSCGSGGWPYNRSEDAIMAWNGPTWKFAGGAHFIDMVSVVPEVTNIA